MKKYTGKQWLRDLKFYDSYSKYDVVKGRKETWEESVADVMRMHYHRFADRPAVIPYIQWAESLYRDRKILASQRSLQYREEQVLHHHPRLFNCASTYIDRPEVFGQIMYVLLCGCGMGYSVENRFIAKLPKLQPRKQTTITFQIPDTIEGWASAVDLLVRSFFNGSEQIRFDGSLIRKEGAFISGGFKAPGYEPLKKSLELIEKLLYQKVTARDFVLSSLDCHEIICMASDAVLSAGVRRSALLCLFDKDDLRMRECKTGDWYYEKPWLARSNNSIKLIKGQFSREELESLKETVRQFGEPGIALVDDPDFTTNPCFEIGFIPVNPRTGRSCISFCNLTEINGSVCTSPEAFYDACRAASIIGTLQASYTHMPHLGADTEELIREEALIGVSITGIMENPRILLDPDTLRKGAEIVKETNAAIAEMIGINPAARTTCIKPSGNASVLLGTTSGIHPAHARRYFRVIQMNKESEIARHLASTKPSMLESSAWSYHQKDYAIYIPVEEPDGAITKRQITDIEFLEHVKTVFTHWVLPGTRIERGYSSRVTHNVSNTTVVQDWDRVFRYVFDHQRYFCGLSFIGSAGDKIYKQAPFTEVLSLNELVDTYGDGVLFASGLIVDALHIFDDDLWDACKAAEDRKFELSGDRMKVLLKKDIVRRIKKFSRNYFEGNMDKTITCLKDVNLFHKWKTIAREMVPIDFSTIPFHQHYVPVSELASIACQGGACEIIP